MTDIRTVGGEPGFGDVHEATARAVWQALGIDPEPAYVGFNEPEVVTASAPRPHPTSSPSSSAGS